MSEADHPQARYFSVWAADLRQARLGLRDEVALLEEAVLPRRRLCGRGNRLLFSVMTDAPFALHSEVVRPEWVDYNGHFNLAYYAVAFDHATDAFFDYLDVYQDYIQRTNCSLFALEMHITYLRELSEGDPIRFTTLFLGLDDKRLHFFHEMHHGEKGYPAATCELLFLNVDVGRRRAASFPAGDAARLKEVKATHDRLPRPPQVGRVMRLEKRLPG